MSNPVLSITTIMLSLAISGSVFSQKKVSEGTQQSDVKFLEDITVEVTPTQPVLTSNPRAVFSESLISIKKPVVSTAVASTNIENAASLQFKYALIMDMEVEMIQNLELFKQIDEWYGTRYRLGGTTKAGIDCSALMQTLFSSLYNINLPRTAKEQHGATKRISRAELREGDLVFFNTIGGVSHVGMYLQNNKFLHASKVGVTISDLYEDYWVKTFIGAGRIDAPSQATASNSRF
jgi:NlpC/P60 family